MAHKDWEKSHQENLTGTALAYAPQDHCVRQNQQIAKITRRGNRNNPMSENKTEVTIGALVLAVAVGFVLYVGQTTGISASTGGYQISAAFRSAEGISTGTDVRLQV